MKRFSHPLGATFTALALAALFFFAWSQLAQATPPQEGVPPLTLALKNAAEGTAMPAVRVQTAASPLTTMFVGPPGPDLATAPEAPLTICGVLGAASCNTVIRFDTRNGLVAGPYWNDYNCVNHSVFPVNSLTYNETGYVFTPPAVRDVSLAVPLVMSDGVQSMNVFAALATSCSNNACIAGSENKNLIIYRHAIYLDAPAIPYTAILDSDNMNGFGDLIIACGSGSAGWCSAQYTDITCNNYTINGTTVGGNDNIIYYDSPYWVDVYAFDGPERVYRIVVNEPRVYSFTLHYAGNPSLVYNNYMGYFLLDSACDQRDVLGGPASPQMPFVGEGMTNTTSSSHLLMPGTYYLVVDGMHLPTQGDAFQLDVQCMPVPTIYLPLVVRNRPSEPTVFVNPASGPVGTEFYFTGIVFAPNEAISHWINEPNGTRHDIPGFTASSDGSFVYIVQLVSGWPTGTYRYSARGAVSQQTASVTFLITSSMAQFEMEERQILSRQQ